MKKKILILFLCLCIPMLAIPAFAAADLPFSDVKADDWFYNDVDYVYKNKLMSGTGANVFSPNCATSRGMIVTILFRMENKPTITTTSTFSDVAAGSYYSDAVAWATSEGIVKGYSASAFGPDDPITREQMAVIMYNFASYKGVADSASADLSVFEDSGSISDYAKAALAWANAKKYISGVSTDRLQPASGATRAQAAAILCRYCTDCLNANSQEATVFCVKYDLNYPEAETYKTAEINCGEKATVPEEPVRDGYVFEGWYELPEGETKYDFNSRITGDITLYAHWSAQSKSDNQSANTPETGTQQQAQPQPEKQPDMNSDNVFALTAKLSDDKKTVELTLELSGKVKLCGFDMRLKFNPQLFTLESLNTNYGFQIYSNADAAPGTVSFNYAGTSNVTKPKTILTATFTVTGQSGSSDRFWLEPVEVIMVSRQEGDAVNAPYALTSQTVIIK